MLKEISVEIIRKCSNMCLHCSSLSSLACGEQMPYELFTEIAADAAKLGAALICLSGGEPFLHRDLIRMVKAVVGAGMNCAIYTSGIGLDDHSRPDALSEYPLRELSNLPVKLIFNIEAGTEETYDQMMGTRGCFSVMQQSVLRAVQAGLAVEANFVPTAVNFREISQTISLCQRLGVSKLNFLKLVIHGRAEQNRAKLELTAKDYEYLREEFKSIQENLSFPIRIGVPLSSETGCAKCEAANGKLNIKYNGEVYPCEVFKNGNAGISIGGFLPENVYKKRLKDIYSDSPYLCAVREQARAFFSSNAADSCIGQYMIRSNQRAK